MELDGSAAFLERSQAISIAFDSMLGLSGLFSLHAAGVVSPGGKGALFVGPGGSGKTTITLRLLGRGWRYLSDDQLALDLTPSGVEARGLRRLLGVVEAEIEQLCGPVDDEALGPRQPNRPDKRRVDADRVFPGQFQETVLPRVLFFPIRGGEAPAHLVPLSPSSALDLLVKYSPWGVRDALTGRQQLHTLKRLSTQCPAFGLLAGPDFASGPGLLSLLASTVEAAA